MVKIGIVGGAGYTAGELLRKLNHPEAEVCFVHSVSNAGNKLSDVHTDLIGEKRNFGLHPSLIFVARRAVFLLGTR